MKQLHLPIFSVISERRAYPEGSDGDQFAVRLTGGIWIIATLANGVWIDYEANTVAQGDVTHWVRLTGERA